MKALDQHGDHYVAMKQFLLRASKTLFYIIIFLVNQNQMHSFHHFHIHQERVNSFNDVISFSMKRVSRDVFFLFHSTSLWLSIIMLIIMRWDRKLNNSNFRKKLMKSKLLDQRTHFRMTNHTTYSTFSLEKHQFNKKNMKLILRLGHWVPLPPNGHSVNKKGRQTWNGLHFQCMCLHFDIRHSGTDPTRIGNFCPCNLQK